jgi:hypothetical protein
MKNRSMFKFPGFRSFSLVLILSFALPVIVYANEYVFATAVNTRLFESPDFKSAVVSQAKRTTQLEVLQNDGIWIQVRQGVVSGWVSRYTVSQQEPIVEKFNLFARIKQFLSPDAGRKRVYLVSTASGIRGISDGEVVSSGVRNEDSLARLESIKINPVDLQTFTDEVVK